MSQGIGRPGEGRAPRKAAPLLGAGISGGPVHPGLAFSRRTRPVAPRPREGRSGPFEGPPFEGRQRLTRAGGPAEPTRVGPDLGRTRKRTERAASPAMDRGEDRGEAKGEAKRIELLSPTEERQGDEGRVRRDQVKREQLERDGRSKPERRREIERSKGEEILEGEGPSRREEGFRET